MDFRTDILPHRDRLYRLALSITMDTAEAEDVVQDVMLRAWERRGEWDTVSNTQAWLMQICKNLSLDCKKRAHFEELQEQDRNHVDTDYDARESVSLIHRFISELPPPLDDLIRLRDIEGLSYREIAQQLSLTEDQVRVYLHRARQKLRDQYLRTQNYGL